MHDKDSPHELTLWQGFGNTVQCRLQSSEKPHEITARVPLKSHRNKKMEITRFTSKHPLLIKHMERIPNTSNLRCLGNAAKPSPQDYERGRCDPLSHGCQVDEPLVLLRTVHKFYRDYFGRLAIATLLISGCRRID